MTNSYFATAFVRAHSVGVTIRAESIGTAFKLAEDYLQERNPTSDVIVQAVQRISDEFADGSSASSRCSNLDRADPLSVTKPGQSHNPPPASLSKPPSASST
jgi:hypothetical protein